MLVKAVIKARDMVPAEKTADEAKGPTQADVLIESRDVLLDRTLQTP